MGGDDVIDFWNTHLRMRTGSHVTITNLKKRQLAILEKKHVGHYGNNWQICSNYTGYPAWSQAISLFFYYQITVLLDYPVEGAWVSRFGKKMSPKANTLQWILVQEQVWKPIFFLFSLATFTLRSQADMADEVHRIYKFEKYMVCHWITMISWWNQHFLRVPWVFLIIIPLQCIAGWQTQYLTWLLSRGKWIKTRVNSMYPLLTSSMMVFIEGKPFKFDAKGW